METATLTIYSFSRTGLPSVSDYSIRTEEELAKIPLDAVKNYITDFNTGFKSTTVGTFHLHVHYVFGNEETEEILNNANRAFTEAESTKKQLSIASEKYQLAYSDYQSMRHFGEDAKTEYEAMVEAKKEFELLESISNRAKKTLLGLHNHFLKLARESNVLIELNH